MEKLNLWQKISAVMNDIEYLQKDDKVSTGGTNSYKAISEEKVTNSVRASLIKNGLVILPVEQQHKRDDTLLRSSKTFNGVVEDKETISRLTTVDIKYKIVNIDNPTEFEILASSGTGVDSQDKGVGKAMTYAYKYMLLRTFAIPTGEDPDKISSEELDKQQEGKKPPKVTPLPKDNVTDFKPNTEGIKCQDCGKEMKPAEVSYSQKFYQANICMACQKKHTRIEGAK